MLNYNIFVLYFIIIIFLKYNSFCGEAFKFWKLNKNSIKTQLNKNKKKKFKLIIKVLN